MTDLTLKHDDLRCQYAIRRGFTINDFMISLSTVGIESTLALYVTELDVVFVGISPSVLEM